MLGLALSICLFPTALRAENIEVKTTPWALGAEIGTAGYGPTVIFTFSKHFTATGGYTWLHYSYDAHSTDARYSGKLELSNMQGLVNWHPTGGSFHFSAGAFISRNKVTISGKPTNGATIDVGGTPYDPSQVGTIAGEVKLAQNLEPYVGFGWAKPPLKGGIGFFADIGILFTSAAKTTLVATGPIASNPTFQTNLHQEEKDINHDLKPLRYYPIIQTGLLYRF